MRRLNVIVRRYGGTPLPSIPRSPAWHLLLQQRVEPPGRIHESAARFVDGQGEGQALFGKHPIGERLHWDVHVSRLVLRAEEELPRRNCDMYPYGKAPVDQLRRKELGGKAFGQLLGVDEGSKDPLAVVKHFGFSEGEGIKVCGPKDNRHTPECTGNGARQGNRYRCPQC
jgi:hypothetical protein